MAIQDGFKILGLTIYDGGGGFATGTGSLSMRAPGSHSIGVGSGFLGRYYTTDPAGGSAAGVIYSASIQARGKNYSSGSWGYQYGGTAAQENLLVLVLEEQDQVQ